MNSIQGSPRGDRILEDETDSQSLRVGHYEGQRDIMNEDPSTLLSSGAMEPQTFLWATEFGSRDGQ